MTQITGNTYPVKDQIKALGGRWDGETKAWMVPDERADEAQRLVSGGKAERTPMSALRDRSKAIRNPRALRDGEQLIWRASHARTDRAELPGETVTLRDGSVRVVVDGAKARGAALQAGDDVEWAVWHIVI